VEIYNSRNDHVEFRIYNAGDRWAAISLITQKLAPNSHFTWDPGWVLWLSSMGLAQSEVHKPDA
jgi:hypothetical protein